MTGADLSRLRSALAELAKLDAIPQLPHLPLRRARIVGQVGDKVSLQMVDRDGEIPDAGQEARQPIWYGVPGVSATHTPGQEVLLAFAQADGSDPVAFAATPRGQPGHVPVLVRHEATTEIVFCGNSAGIVRVGSSAARAVAIAQPLKTYLDALEEYLLLVDALVTSDPLSKIPARKAAKLLLDSTLASAKLKTD